MKKSLVFSLSLLGCVGIATATPAVTLGLLGRYLDKHFNTFPRYLIALMVLALIISLVAIFKIAKKVSQDLNNLNK